LFNLTYWLIFATMIEKNNGSAKVLMLFVSIALISGIVQNFFSGPAFFGLSGVVYGVLGYVYVMSRFDRRQRYRLPGGFIYMLLVGIAVGFIGPLVDLHFGNAAHISGLAVGILIALFDSQKWFAKSV
jgi:GlpG protein